MNLFHDITFTISSGSAADRRSHSRTPPSANQPAARLSFLFTAKSPTFCFLGSNDVVERRRAGTGSIHSRCHYPLTRLSTVPRALPPYFSEFPGHSRRGQRLQSINRTTPFFTEKHVRGEADLTRADRDYSKLIPGDEHC